MSNPSKQFPETEDVINKPIEQFLLWLKDAEQHQGLHANAMTVATASREGSPAARIVLLRGVDERGFVFFTNYESEKGSQLAENPQAALVFYWSRLNRQVRVEGTIEKVAAMESDSYFSGRPRGHQLSAHASSQSKIIESHTILEQELDKAARRFEGKEVPRPAHWGGYRVVPRMIEFWQEGEHRLHDRLRYTIQRSGGWKAERLAP